jgi:glucosamine-6-phosphate deaminase
MKSTQKSTQWRFDNANALYYGLLDAFAEKVSAIVATGRKPVIALPTGNTMIPFYRLVTEHQAKLKVHEWICFNLDEYYPIHESNEFRTFNAFMDLNFYLRLDHPVQVRRLLDGRTKNPEQECAEYEAAIQAHGGIDIALLGLGINGHVAFNEPKSAVDSRTRLVELHPQTLMANFQGEAVFTHAMTMGLGTLLEAREIFVVALGKNKAEAVRCAVAETPSVSCPASALQFHSHVTWFLDQEAAGSL